MSNEVQFFDSFSIERNNGVSTLYLNDSQDKTSFPIKLARTHCSQSETYGIKFYAIDESGAEFQYRKMINSKEEADILMDEIHSKFNIVDQENNRIFSGN